MEEADLPRPRLVLVDYLPRRITGYCRYDPCEIVANRERWEAMSAQEQAQFIAHEWGHLATATLHAPESAPCESTTIRHEAMADRRGLLALVPEIAVRHAIASGCTELYEFAEAWHVDEPTALARLRIHNPAAFRR